GHNPFEPTALGAALIAGPSTRNFAPAYSALAEGDGYRAINGAEALGPAVAALIDDEAARLRMAAAAAEALAAAKPDLDPIIDAAEALMTAKVSG
ncbi:MAG: hypothetical protein AAFY66_01865, partial [Pseudomonadota bacterium]